MDIDLLAKMVKELILDNDRVVLPGLGAFVAEVVPSTFSDRGYTINPPYRKLYFRAKPDEGQELADFYACSNNIAPEIGDKIIRDFVSELKDVLYAKKAVVFPGLGRLRATKENAVFFVADEDLDIYPEGFALEPVSLKTHVETPADITAVVADLKAVVDGTTVVEDAVVADDVEEVPEVVETAEVVMTEPSVEPSYEPSVESSAEPSVGPSVDEVAVSADENAEESVTEESVTEEPVTEEPVTEEPVVEEPVVESKATEEKSIKKPEIVGVVKNVPTDEYALCKTVGKVLLWVVIAVALLLGTFAAVSRLHPRLFDSILYTPEELEIINR